MALNLSIVVSGPESSGKSTLCRELASLYDAPWVPEYARHYLEKYGPSYNYRDFERMLQGHIERQQAAIQKNPPLLFLDTDLVNYQVWGKWVFGKVPALLEQHLSSLQSHHYLLTYPDIPWEADPLRENPGDREAIYEAHRGRIEELGRPYASIYGSAGERLRRAEEALHKWGVRPPSKAKN